MIDDRDNPPAPVPRAEPALGTTAQEAGAALQERAGDLREAARTRIEDAKSAAAEQTEAAKGQAAEEISRTARGLEAAAAELEGSAFQQDLLREAADGLKQISRAMQGKSIGVLVEDLSEFGRRNPLAYLGGAALAGFALARFAKAGAPDDDTPGRDERMGGPPDYPAPPAPYAATTPEAPAETGVGGSDDA